MTEEYRLGIHELDTQHDEIAEVMESLVEAVRSRDKWHLVHFILVRLYEVLRFHFALEEAVMRIVGYPEGEEHKRVHKKILDKVEEFKILTLKNSDFDDANIAAHELTAARILDHDKQFAEFLKAHSGSLHIVS